IDIYGKLFIKHAEDKFKEKFLKGKDISKAFKNLLARLERYKLASGKEYPYLNKENTLRFYQIYLFIKKDYKQCFSNAKKSDEEGALFNANLFKELKKKEISKKNLLKILGSSILLKEIPLFYELLSEHQILNLAKIKILEAKPEDINEKLLDILWKIYEKKEINIEELENKFINSKTYYSRYLLFSGKFEKAYDIIMDMNYFEFMSLSNKSYILEILRKNNNYDQLLTYYGKIYDKSFIDDEILFYYVMALNNFLISEKGNILLTKIDFSKIKFLNSASEACNEDQYPNKTQIDAFLKKGPTRWEIYELFNFLKDFASNFIEEYSEQLEELMDEKDFQYLKGRILLVKTGKFEEAKKILKDSPYPEDWEISISLSSDPKEISRLIEQLTKYHEAKKTKMDNLKTFLPFSYKSIFNYNFFEKYLGYKERAYEQLKNMNELDKQMVTAREIITMAPTKIGYYNELFYLLRDFKKDPDEALKIIDRLIYFNEKNTEYIIEKAKLLYSIGNLDDALNILLKIEDRTKEVSEEIAHIYEERQLFFDAISIYDKLFIETEEIKYLEKIIQFYFSLELYEKILSLNKKYSDINSDIINYYQGLVYFRTNRYEKSLEMLDKIDAATFEKNDEIIIYKGLNYFNLMNFGEANKYLKRALQRKVKEEIAWTKLAEILYNNGKLDNAYQAIDKAIKKGNNDSDAYLLASEIYLAKDMKSDFVKKMKELRKMKLPETSDAHFRYGNLLLKMGKSDKAEVELHRALHLNENNMKALNTLIEIYLKEENYTQTLPLLSQAFKKEPQKIAYNYSRVLFILKKYSEAKDIAQYVKDSSVETWLLKGKIYFELGSFSEALGKFQKVIELKPKNVEAYIYIGRIYYEKFKLKEALETLSKAENIMEDNATVFKYLGLTYNKIGETINAIIYLKKSILKSSHDHETILELGNLYYNKNRYNEALKEFDKVIKIKYDLPQVHLLIAKAYRHLEKYDLSLKAINRAIEFLPNDPIFLEEKVTILETMSRYPEIISILEKIESENGLSLKLELLKIKTLRINGRLNLAYSGIEKINAPDTISFEVDKEKAFILYQKKEYEEALPILKALYEESPKDDELLTIFAFTLIELKRFKTLQNYLRNYRGNLLKTEYIPYLLGYIEYEENSDEYAINYFYQAIAINRAFVPAYRKLGEIYFKKKNYIMSVDILKSAIYYEKSKKMDLYYYLALSYAELGKYFEALRYIKEALKWNYLDSAEKMVMIYEKLKLHAFGVIITRKLLLNSQIDKYIAWRMLILFLFNLNRKLDGIIEGFYNYNNIKNSEQNLYPFAKELLDTYEKPNATYNVIKPIINEKTCMDLVSIYIRAMGDISIWGNEGIIKEVEEYENRFKDSEEYNIFESFGVFWYKHGNLLKAKIYFEKALKINPQLDDSVYYLSLMK
ncbi:tetratricopeptide repeat protein, partial [bacterium]|nr:tetratricopeptide repeat protein [bacterium]